MGQLGANLGNTNVTDPRQARPQDLDRNEMGARVIAQGTRGLANGFQNYQNQNSQMRSAGPQMGNVPVAQNPDLSYLMPKGNNLAFYGGS